MHIVEFSSHINATGKEVHYVEIAASVLDKQSVSTKHRVKDLDPTGRQFPSDSEKGQIMAARWAQIGPAYDAWLQGNEIPETGTSIMSWAALTPEQVKGLRHAGLRTVEEVAGMTDSNMGRLKLPHARELRDQAAKFLEGLGASELTERLDHKDAQIAEMLAQMEAMQAQLEAKPKRGRPPKNPEEVEAA